MKIKYRRIEDNDYIEVECDVFIFYNDKYITGSKTRLDWVLDGKLGSVSDVCNVYIEEI